MPFLESAQKVLQQVAAAAQSVGATATVVTTATHAVSTGAGQDLATWVQTEVLAGEEKLLDAHAIQGLSAEENALFTDVAERATKLGLMIAQRLLTGTETTATPTGQ
jgi:hypothetical protein